MILIHGNMYSTKGIILVTRERYSSKLLNIATITGKNAGCAKKEKV